MAKFIKSLFHTEKRSVSYDGTSDEEPSPMDTRRKMSVSRSGRMKQAQKKRSALALEIYGDDNLPSNERPKSREYHVHPHSAPVIGTAPRTIEVFKPAFGTDTIVIDADTQAAPVSNTDTSVIQTDTLDRLSDDPAINDIPVSGTNASDIDSDIPATDTETIVQYTVTPVTDSVTLIIDTDIRDIDTDGPAKDSDNLEDVQPTIQKAKTPEEEEIDTAFEVIEKT